MNHELPDVQAGFRKGTGTRDQIVNIHWMIKKSKSIPQKSLLLLLDYAKAFDCVDYNKVWKILKRDGNTRPLYLPPEKPVCMPRSNS